MGFGAAWLGLVANTSLVFANNTPILRFRQNAAPLQLHFNENSLGMSPNAYQQQSLPLNIMVTVTQVHLLMNSEKSWQFIIMLSLNS
ncbi:hypothetical protein [Paraglaciecola psychrophila]|uniref:Uncharacterized protein n=1 Tax=Paraglaciecola psychrophila 170 TaxID=1129794 RepID=K6ZM41_9ALTE|nr:hypothetical protein [Paraglaciecola psychrophila]AGH43304.1 hypothetical protein C427_1195 [Paraglaciecola psychrophila 170]GAC37031.1 hypothetical protein GPSY_1396 [Paraglaciecola psychrophila 170]